MSLGIYIHIPFCHRRCSYCDFYLTTNMKLVDNFVKNLRKEIKLFGQGKKLEADTIYFGGGTPSILEESHFDDIFESIHKGFKISVNPEITAECNPEDILDGGRKIGYMKKSGFNRLSLGVQSFDDNELSFLTRFHNSIQAEEAVKAVSGLFVNYSVDIIYDLPGQDISSIGANLSKISELKVPHVSAYTLITEKGTLLYKKLKDSPDYPEKTANESLYSHISGEMNKLGYNHYEISNYSLTGYESRHNLKYWNFSDYVGFGPSAHSFFEGKRWNNFRDLKKYSDIIENNSLPWENCENPGGSTLEEDYFICVLRGPGILKDMYRKIFKKDFDETYGALTKKLEELELGTDTGGSFALSEKGFALADSITLEFVKMI